MFSSEKAFFYISILFKLCVFVSFVAGIFEFCARFWMCVYVFVHACVLAYVAARRAWQPVEVWLG